MTQAKAKAMEQRLVRGNSVIVADSFGRASLRGEKQIVASKGPVKCNGNGRCAGNWCMGLAVFLTNPETKNDEKHLGWRSGTTKICLTHIKDEEGSLILPPPAMHMAQTALKQPIFPRTEATSDEPVSWEELANTVSERDWVHLTLLARKLKRENETLRQTVSKTQDELIVVLKSKLAAFSER